MFASASNVALRTASVVTLSFILISGMHGARAEGDRPAFEDGRELYQQSCAFCHGAEARGNGIAAPTLEKAPADLTQLSSNNGGVFPWRAAYRQIEGTDVPDAHGGRDMPIFGDRWSAGVPGEYVGYYVRGKILEILLYLESIQTEPGPAEPDPAEPGQG